MRSEVLNTLIEDKVPVTFKDVKDKKNKQRELVYYHLKQLVKDGHVVKETDSDGDTLYRCDPVFYDELTLEIAITAYKTLIDRMGSVESATEMLDIALLRVKRTL